MTPASRAVPICSRRNDAAPRVQFADPPRSRTPEIRGAPVRVDRAEASRFRPRTVTTLPWILVAPNAAPVGHPVDAALAGVDVEVGQHVLAGQQRSTGGQPGQQPPVHRVQLADVAVAERAQEAAERRGRPDLGEHVVQAAVAQHVHVIDGVGAHQHPGDQAADLQRRARGLGAGDADIAGRGRSSPAASASRIAGSTRRPRADFRCRTPNASSGPRAGNTLAKCPLDLGDRGVINLYHPRSEGTFVSKFPN